MLFTSPQPALSKTPAWLYVAGITVGIGVGVVASNPLWFLVLLILALVAAFLYAGWRNPWVALGFIVAQYPILNTLRTIYSAHHLPVFAAGVRFLPDLLQFVIIGQLMIRGIKNPAHRLKIYGDDLPVVTYILLGIYSVIIAVQYTHPYAPINGWYVSISPAVFYLIIRWLKPSSAQGMQFLRWMVFCYSALMVPSLFVYFTRPEWYMTLQNAEHGFFVPAGMHPFTFWRIYPRMEAFLFEENHWGTLSELVAILCAAYLVRSRLVWQRALLMILSTLCMVFSISRGAMISFVVAMVVLLLHGGEHRKNLVVALAVLCAIAGAGIYALNKSAIVVETITRLDTVNAGAVKSGAVANDRSHQWRNGWQIFLATPSGMGLGTVGNGASLSKMSPFIVGDGLYIRVLAEQGIPGIVGFAYLILGIPWTLWRHRALAPPAWRPLGVGLFAFHFGFCIHGIGANTFDFYCVAPIYFMLLGLYVSAVYAERERLQAAVKTPLALPSALTPETVHA